MSLRSHSLHWMFLIPLAVSAACVAGCGRTISQQATEQLLASDAVDRAIAQLDFRVLNGQKVYFDSRYVNNVKGLGFVNADYIVSSLRQQIVAAGCLLQDRPEDADYVVEARVGALGTNAHEVSYGIPASNGLSQAASLVPTAPPIPAIPELSVAKKNDQSGAAKVAVFAYERESRAPIWQSGVSVARSSAKDAWWFGAGPFQRGTIYEGVEFAGTRLNLPLVRGDDGKEIMPIDYHDEIVFNRPRRKPPSEIVQAKGEETEQDVKQPEKKKRKQPEKKEDEPAAKTDENPQPVTEKTVVPAEFEDRAAEEKTLPHPTSASASLDEPSFSKPADEGSKRARRWWWPFGGDD